MIKFIEFRRQGYGGNRKYIIVFKLIQGINNNFNAKVATRAQIQEESEILQKLLLLQCM